jgi:YD repeat-containing protein
MIIFYVKVRPARYLFIAVWLFLSPLGLRAQLAGSPTQPFSVNIVPPSPQAAALAKYADIPVSLYSGTPQIAIPLYELQERKLNLPITLSYHASGHKVETVAPNTGLGWTVLAEGVVTRSVRGWPDENRTNGFLYQASIHQITDFTEGLRPADLQYQWYNDMAEGCMDVEPDIFYVNMPGHSFKFMFNWQGVPVIASEQRFKVTPLGMNPGTNDFIDGWEITAEDGTVYVFNVIETTDVRTASDHAISCRLVLDEADIPQSWYLSEMRTPDQQTWIRFEYTGYTQHNNLWSVETKVHNEALAPATTSREGVEMTVYGKHLSKITTSSGQTVVDFLPGTPRTDIVGTESTLGGITVKNINGKVVKDWTFEYDYSIGRLTLKKLTEKAGTATLPPYTFAYNSGTLPPISSWSKDHWGFYNDNNFQSAIPATEVPRWGSTQPVRLPGANREPSPAKVLCGMLREIQYPAGGKDLLQFEPHDYSFMQNQELISETTVPRYHSASVPDRDNTLPGQEDEHRYVFTLPSATAVRWQGWFTFNARFAGGQLGIFIERNSDHAQVLQFALGAPREENTNEDFEQGVVNLLAGSYTLILTGRMGIDPMESNYLTGVIAWDEGTGQRTTLVRQGGGVRIAKITRSYGNDNPDKISRYVYRIQEDGRDKSSGSLLETAFHYERWLRYLPALSNPVDKFYRFSQNSAALGATQGSHVGYSLVTVLNGENGEFGKATYRYNSPREIGDYGHYEMPYPPPTSYDYRRGLLLEQAEFAVSGVTVQKVENKYNYYDAVVLAQKTGWRVPGDANSPTGPGFLGRYASMSYSNVLGYSRLKESRRTNYKIAMSLPTSTLEKYTYNEGTHRQLTRVIRSTSAQDSTVVQYTYPDDFAAGDAVLDAMKTRHMRNQVIETVTSKKGAGTSYSLTAAAKKTYVVKGSCIVPDKEWSAPLTYAMPTTDPVATARSIFEDRLLYHGYDSYGNLVEHSLKNGMRTAYVWGYAATVPLAKVDHARPQQVYFTSFEEGAGTTTAQYRTGKRSKAVNGTFTVPASITVAGDYVLSYWAREGSATWSYRERAISNYQPGGSIVTDAVNGYIDEVRVYPKGASMTTYTYEPLIGVTSVTDANNVTAFYEYDAFGRLSCMRDQDNNILECYDYRYRQEIPFAVH